MNDRTTLTPREFAVNVRTVEDGIKWKESESGINNREKAMTFLFRAYGGVLTATVIIIFLQGFHAWGFNLDAAFMKWLGVATVGEIGGLAGVVYGALFKKSNNKSSSLTNTASLGSSGVYNLVGP